MIRPTAVYLDFTCPWSARAWRWLSLLPQRFAVDVRPYWHAEGGVDSPWDRVRTDVGLELLALGELAREHGPRAHRAYIDAAFAAAQVPRTDLGDPEVWLGLAERAGLDLGRFAADSERWRAEVGLWHREAEDRFGVRRAPALVVEDRAVLELRLRRSVPDQREARRLLGEVSGLLRAPVGSRG